MSELLKPCPFCGNENPHATHDDYVHENGQPMPVVECTNCHTWVRAESWSNRVSDAALSAKDARIAELEAERTEWVEAYWKTHHQSGHIKRSNHRGDSYGQQQAEPDAATHSEDGQEVPKVVGYRSKRNGLVDEDSHVLHEAEPLMTVAQHSRIVAAKDAEIARLQQFNISLNQENTRLFSDYSAADDECVKLRALLDAQPARQVGGMEEGNGME